MYSVVSEGGIRRSHLQRRYAVGLAAQSKSRRVEVVDIAFPDKAGYAHVLKVSEYVERVKLIIKIYGAGIYRALNCIAKIGEPAVASVYVLRPEPSSGAARSIVKNVGCSKYRAFSGKRVLIALLKGGGID